MHYTALACYLFCACWLPFWSLRASYFRISHGFPLADYYVMGAPDPVIVGRTMIRDLAPINAFANIAIWAGGFVLFRAGWMRFEKRGCLGLLNGVVVIVTTCVTISGLASLSARADFWYPMQSTGAFKKACGFAGERVMLIPLRAAGLWSRTQLAGVFSPALGWTAPDLFLAVCAWVLPWCAAWAVFRRFCGRGGSA
ncbi:MAG TPA: hypothetical protein PL033_04750 [Candidatus Brocadiia bacterium]|nr:hypothetical protein [Candidatus Brocadiia bacterium]